VIVTHDDDLLALAAQGVHHAGITFQIREPEHRQIVLKLSSLSRQNSPDDFIDRIEFL
jgi:hypothetical protein